MLGLITLHMKYTGLQHELCIKFKANIHFPVCDALLSYITQPLSCDRAVTLLFLI